MQCDAMRHAVHTSLGLYPRTRWSVCTALAVPLPPGRPVADAETLQSCGVKGDERGDENMGETIMVVHPKERSRLTRSEVKSCEL